MIYVLWQLLFLRKMCCEWKIRQKIGNDRELLLSTVISRQNQNISGHRQADTAWHGISTGSTVWERRSSQSATEADQPPLCCHVSEVISTVNRTELLHGKLNQADIMGRTIAIYHIQQ